MHCEELMDREGSRAHQSLWKGLNDWCHCHRTGLTHCLMAPRPQEED